MASRTRHPAVPHGTASTRVALVTGASSGIGHATAERLAEGGFTVFGTSRRAASGGKHGFEMIALDVTNDASVHAAVAEVLRKTGRIDVLVNNAGFGVGIAGDEETSIEQTKSLFETNFFGTVRMTRAVVPHMRSRGAGRILNMGSGLGLFPMPYMAFYSATKHALEGYSESLDHELRTRGIRVAVIEPGVTKTSFDANVDEPDSKLEEYAEIRGILNKKYGELLAAGDSPDAVAEVVLQAANARRPKLRYPVGSVATVALLRRFAPALTDAGIRRQLGLDLGGAS